MAVLYIGPEADASNITINRATVKGNVGEHIIEIDSKAKVRGLSVHDLRIISESVSDERTRNEIISKLADMKISGADKKSAFDYVSERLGAAASLTTVAQFVETIWNKMTGS